MRLIYLFHSGFLIEAEDFSIIFDYYRGGENIIEKALRRRQPMYVWYPTNIATIIIPKY